MTYASPSSVKLVLSAFIDGVVSVRIIWVDAMGLLQMTRLNLLSRTINLRSFITKAVWSKECYVPTGITDDLYVLQIKKGICCPIIEVYIVGQYFGMPMILLKTVLIGLIREVRILSDCYLAATKLKFFTGKHCLCSG